MKKNINRLMLVIVFITCIIQSGMAQEQIKAYRATNVWCYTPGRQIEGLFMQVGGNKWKEMYTIVSSKVQGRNYYTEQSRDEWSIYLRDDSRQVNVQIDLFQKKIYATDSRGRREAYIVDYAKEPEQPHNQVIKPVIQDQGQQQQSSSGFQWSQLSGAASDIGIGANGSVWIIGTNSVNGGYGIFHWNGSNWDAVDGGAVRIAVDPNGTPWVLNDKRQIFRREGNGWKEVGGLARDIGIGSDGTVWVIGTTPVGGGFEIFRYNGNGWQKTDGGAIRIAVDNNGLAWVVNDGGGIFRRTNTGQWHNLPGGARDIGVGADGSAWVIGTNKEGGGYGIYKFNGRDWNKVPGGANHISVAPNGNAWVVNEAGKIFAGKN
ncbi:MAG TPA: hypothetical protein PLC48_13680 [Ferruginibacter sp.]|nr:hypothetical protein [Ferruginibacter sp.]